MRKVSVELSKRDRALIRKYGYPFEPVVAALDAVENLPGFAVVEVEPFWLEQLVGNLSYSCNRARNRGLAEELSDICERIECDLTTSR